MPTNSARRTALLAILVMFPAAAMLGAAAAPSARAIPAATGCTNPAHHGQAAPGGGLDPAQLAAAYGVSGLWQSGYRGQGRHVALLEVGASLEKSAFTTLSDCYGPFATPVEHVVVGSNPSPGGEGIFDPDVVSAIAPQARIDMFESGAGVGQSSLPQLLEAALDPANTGGTLVDTISTSFGKCEATWASGDVAKMQAALAHAASLGVAVFAAGGDSGSVASYRANGTTSCIGHPVDVAAAKHDAGVSLGVGYPASSPLVTSVGGTELAIDGKVPSEGSPKGGTITDEPVWNEAQPKSPGMVYAGGGGHSALFAVADAPWQRQIGLSGQESKPDIAALSGSPKYLKGGIGTSGAAPMMAGAIALLDGYLADHGIARTGPLNPVLYALYADPAARASVFNDVVTGNNDLVGLGCCTAGPGYDMASGLGSLNVEALGRAIVAKPSVVAAATSSTTTAAAAPGPSATVRPTPAAALPAAAHSSGGGSTGLVVVIVVIAAAVLAAGGYVGLRRRRS